LCAYTCRESIVKSKITDRFYDIEGSVFDKLVHSGGIGNLDEDIITAGSSES
jgi:hypothetical protein